jgi:hypothetical protein
VYAKYRSKRRHLFDGSRVGCGMTGAFGQRRSLDSKRSCMGKRIDLILRCITIVARASFMILTYHFLVAAKP